MICVRESESESVCGLLFSCRSSEIFPLCSQETKKNDLFVFFPVSRLFERGAPEIGAMSSDTLPITTQSSLTPPPSLSAVDNAKRIKRNMKRNLRKKNKQKQERQGQRITGDTKSKISSVPSSLSRSVSIEEVFIVSTDSLLQCVAPESSLHLSLTSLGNLVKKQKSMIAMASSSSSFSYDLGKISAMFEKANADTDMRKLQQRVEYHKWREAFFSFKRLHMRMCNKIINLSYRMLEQVKDAKKTTDFYERSCAEVLNQIETKWGGEDFKRKLTTTMARLSNRDKLFSDTASIITFIQTKRPKSQKDVKSTLILIWTVANPAYMFYWFHEGKKSFATDLQKIVAEQDNSVVVALNQGNVWLRVDEATEIDKELAEKEIYSPLKIKLPRVFAGLECDWETGAISDGDPLIVTG